MSEDEKTEGEKQVPRFRVATVVELSIIGMFPASEYIRLDEEFTRGPEEETRVSSSNEEAEGHGVRMRLEGGKPGPLFATRPGRLHPSDLEAAQRLARAILAGVVKDDDPPLPIPFSYVGAGRWFAAWVLKNFPPAA